MRARPRALIDEFDREPPPTVDPAIVEETKAFLAVAGRRQLHVPRLPRVRPGRGRRRGASSRRSTAPGSGILRGAPTKAPKTLTRQGAHACGREPQILLLTKANSPSTVHRPAYLDYVGVKKYDEDGRVVGERRFLGLYTTAAYKASPRSIPMLRGKVEGVLERAGFPPASHDRKALESRSSSPTRATRCSRWRPRSCSTSRSGSSGSASASGCGCSCGATRSTASSSAWCASRATASTPRTASGSGRILLEALGGVALDWTLQLSESRLARVHYIIRLGEEPVTDYDVGDDRGPARAGDPGLDRRPARGADRRARRGGRASSCSSATSARSRPATGPTGWRARRSPTSPGSRSSPAPDEPITSLYRPLEAPEGIVRLKLFSSGGVLLSDVLPTFEHLGAKVADERPYEITPADRRPVWIYDFGLQADAENLERVRDLLHDAFLGVWRGDLEDDRLNGLVLGADPDRAPGLDHPRGRQVPAPGRHRLLGRLHRAHADSRTPTSPGSWSSCSTRGSTPTRPTSDAAERLGRRDRGGARRRPEPRRGPDPAQLPVASCARSSAPTPSSRRADGEPHPYLSFKLDSSQIPVLPLPRPQFEIFVYSPRVEAVHLRGGKVARGGIRWSDRREDFRTEVLGLMKAQMVKNALIVPVGAKGGFVRQAPADRGRPRGPACTKASPATRRSCRGCSTSPTTSSRARSCRPSGWSATTTTTRTWSSRRTRAPRRSPTSPTRSRRLRLLARRRVRLGRLAGLRPQGDGDHRARRVGVGQAPLPRARHRHPDDRLHGGRDRRHVRRRVRQRDAALAAHQAGRRVQPHARVHRPRPGPGTKLRGAQAPVRAAALGLERLRRVADLRGRRRLPADARSRSRSRPRRARRSGSRPSGSRRTS